MNRKTEVMAVLDLGTSKTVVMVAVVGQDGISILGLGISETEGIRKGVITSIQKTVESIHKAKADAEQMSGYVVAEVIASVGGTSVFGINNNGSITIKPNKEIKKSDVDKVIEQASALSLPPDRQTVAIIPKQYCVDKHEGIKDPIGMTGVRLDVDVHLITAGRAVIGNIQKCIERAGLKVVEFVPSPLASALAVLLENEREMGVVVLDLGAGCGDLTIWANGSLIHTCVIGGGGNLITQDIATGLRTPFGCAEELKIKYGAAIGTQVRQGETIEVPGIGGRDARVLSRYILTEIIEPRMKEIFELVKKEINHTGYDDLLSAGLVLTGGASLMPGITELADHTLNLPVRIGAPSNVKGLAGRSDLTSLATAYGLVVYSALPYISNQPHTMLPVRMFRKKRGMFSKILEWFS